MERQIFLRSLYRSAFGRFFRIIPATFNDNHFRNPILRLPCSSPSRSFFHFASLSASSTLPRSRDWGAHFAWRIGSVRSFVADDAHLAKIRDPGILSAFKELMAADWGELEEAVIYDAKKALSKSTDHKASQEALANVFRAAEAVDAFSGQIVYLRMILDQSSGPLGESVKPLSDEIMDALGVIYKKYVTYLDAFGPDEAYLRKKVEAELGKRMIQLKMRCRGLGVEWGKITALGTSGLSGSYIEYRKH